MYQLSLVVHSLRFLLYHHLLHSRSLWSFRYHHLLHSRSLTYTYVTQFHFRSKQSHEHHQTDTIDFHVCRMQCLSNTTASTCNSTSTNQEKNMKLNELIIHLYSTKNDIITTLKSIYGWYSDDTLVQWRLVGLIPT